jgi:tetratricopeptide (TPR) repeat protein
LGKDAAARASMTTGGWTRAESYRDLIKDKRTAVALERQIEQVYARHQAEPQSVDLARRLGLLYEQNEDTENAIAWFQYAADLTNNTDASLLRKVSDLQRGRAEAEITAHENFLANHGPDAPEYADRSEALALAKKQQGELTIAEARKRSERNPTDLQLRFQLGERLVEAGRLREALPELQRARQNPNARLKSMKLLGCCYRDLGVFDLAAKQLEEAAKEITTMDAMKKEIVYNLGLVYEEMGEAEKSIGAMKQIFEADYGYRDVAARVERSYERK